MIVLMLALNTKFISTFRGRGMRLGMNKWYLKYDPETTKP